MRKPHVKLFIKKMKKYQSDYNRIMSLIYEDQPISPQAGKEVVFIPERIRSIRSLGRGVSAYRQPREVIFRQQAKLMEDYEDDYEYSRDIPAYQPTYESLTDEQLRGYFGWRTKIRMGEYQKAPQAFAFIYMYELINLIGVKKPLQGFYRLLVFTERYGKLDTSIIPHAEQWLIDYVLYYDLDPELLSERKSVLYDQALSLLLKQQEKAQPGVSFLKSVFFISGIKAEELPAYSADAELFRRVTEDVFKEMRGYYEDHRKTSFLEDYVGLPINQPVRFFAGAVFHDMQERNNRNADLRPDFRSRYRWVNELLTENKNDTVKEVKLSDITTYHYEHGKWSVKMYPRDYRNRKFADLLITIDAVIREEEGEKEAELTGLQTKWTRKLIRKAVRDCRQRLEEEKARRVEIDFSSLEHIRSDAENTMEKLMTEDELDLEEAYEPVTEEDHPEWLNPEEYALVRCLLDKEDPQHVNLNGKIMSVIVDSVNEKLFDEIGDIVIENGNPPTLVEDYAEEVKGLIS